MPGAELVCGPEERLARGILCPLPSNRHEIDRSPSRTLAVVQRGEPRRLASTGAFAFGVRALETPRASHGLRQMHALRTANPIYARGAAQISIVAADHIDMEVTVNGATRIIEAPTADIAALIRALGLEGKRIAVERNGEIVPKSRYADTRVLAGDRLEVVAAVGGG